MWRFSTKTDLERDNEETERLVRESPKVKPPRYDRRREQVETDQDTDLDQEDRDLSKNYKTIGGSVYTAKENLINVRLKKDPSHVVQVTKKTLQSDPGKYEEIKSEAEKLEKKPKSKKPISDTEKAPVTEDISDAEVSRELKEIAKKDKEFASILKDFVNPKSDIFQFTKDAPDISVEQFLRGRTPPKGIKTVGDLQRVLSYKGKEPEKKPTKAPSQDEKEPSKEPEKKSKKPSKEPEKKLTKAPGAPDRPYSRDELNAAHSQLIMTFPTKVAVGLMLVKPPIHPDEISELLSNYNVAKSLTVKLDGIEAFRDAVSKVYVTNPNQVPPPKKVKNKRGGNILFEDLPEEERPKAIRQHQMQTLAMSLAAEGAIAKSLEDNGGVPKDLADDLAGFMLSGHKESPEDRLKRAGEKAENLFYQELQEKTDRKPVADEIVKKVLKSISKDPAVSKIAVGYFQALDYKDARKRFLDSKSEESISENLPPDVIASRLGKAMNFLRGRSERYSEGTVTQDTAATFRARVTKYLEVLVPDKKTSIEKLLDKEDNRHYDKALKKYQKNLNSYQKALDEAEKEAEAEFEEEYVTPHLRKKSKPILSGRDRLIIKGVFEPREPVKPPRYDLDSKNPKELEETAEKLWESFKSRTANHRIIAKVVDCYLFDAFFIYSTTSAMGTNYRQAVYWGVPPSEVKYQDWSQPEARNLGEQDYIRLLKAAREWLKSPVLSSDIKGIVKDTQLRAALDLAIRTEGYDNIIHPTLYNNLLASLAGKSQDEPLLTVTANQKNGSETMREKMSNKVELNAVTTDQLLARLDRVASVVQENHEKWGMRFEAAKGLVNEIDKIADELETAAYGSESVIIRQAQLISGTDKTAEVVQRESDEGYMDTFRNPMAPIQTEANEPYMKAYGDDQSSAVHHGKSETGRPLAP